jgi:hypothetical protein
LQAPIYVFFARSLLALDEVPVRLALTQFSSGQFRNMPTPIARYRERTLQSAIAPNIGVTVAFKAFTN